MVSDSGDPVTLFVVVLPPFPVFRGPLIHVVPDVDDQHLGLIDRRVRNVGRLPCLFRNSSKLFRW